MGIGLAIQGRKALCSCPLLMIPTNDETAHDPAVYN